MIIITATMLKMYAVVIIITHYVILMLSSTGEQQNAETDFKNVGLEFHLFVWKLELPSNVLDSCKKFKCQDYFSNYFQLYQYISLKALMHRLGQYYTRAAHGVIFRQPRVSNFRKIITSFLQLKSF